MCAPRSHRFAFVTHHAVKTALLVALALACLPAPARADGVFGGSLGYFVVKSEDARPEFDVLSENLRFLAFEIDDFNGVTFGGEFMFGLGDYVEAGVGAGYYQRTVPSVYWDYVDFDGTEVAQDLKLRITPVTFTARVFPVGRHGSVQPYVGGGVALLVWRYSESGEFVDFANPFPDGTYPIYRETYVDDGTETAPVVFGGVRFPVGDNFLIGGEFRWQGGEAGLDVAGEGFAGDRLSLGGYTTSATFQFRF
jgi:hypothetical protein